MATNSFSCGMWSNPGAIPNSDCPMTRRYWEDEFSDRVLPRIDGELDNKPGRGRIERLTHDEFKYASVKTSDSGRLVTAYPQIVRRA